MKNSYGFALRFYPKATWRSNLLPRYRRILVLLEPSNLYVHSFLWLFFVISWLDDGICIAYHNGATNTQEFERKQNSRKIAKMVINHWLDEIK